MSQQEDCYSENLVPHLTLLDLGTVHNSSIASEVGDMGNNLIEARLALGLEKEALEEESPSHYRYSVKKALDLL